MARLFGKVWRVQIDTLRFTELGLSFSVEKSLRREPNKAVIQVFNLSADHRHQIEQLNTTRRRGPGRIRLVLEAGYGDAMPVIFRGDLRTGLSHKEEDGTWVTKLEGEDGGRAVLWSRVSRSFPAGTPVTTVVRACAEAMGVGIGNTDEAIAAVTLESGGDSFTEGTVLSGRAPDELDGVLDSVGLTWSVQDGVLQLLQRGRALQQTAVLLTGRSGLVGTPQRAADGTVNVRCALHPDVYPGRQIALDSVNVAGTFRARKCKYTGDSHGNTWYIDSECVELVSAA